MKIQIDAGLVSRISSDILTALLFLVIAVAAIAVILIMALLFYILALYVVYKSKNLYEWLSAQRIDLAKQYNYHVSARNACSYVYECSSCPFTECISKESIFYKLGQIEHETEKAFDDIRTNVARGRCSCELESNPSGWCIEMLRDYGCQVSQADDGKALVSWGSTDT